MSTGNGTLRRNWVFSRLILTFLEDISPFLSSQWCPCFGLLVTSALGFKAACMLCHLHATESSDSPLVPQLLTSWWPAWQLSRSHPHTCIQANTKIYRVCCCLTVWDQADVLPTDLCRLQVFKLSMFVISSSEFCVTVGRISDTIWKNSVSHWGVEPGPLAIRASIIPLDYQDTDRCHIWKISTSLLLKLNTCGVDLMVFWEIQCIVHYLLR